MFLYKKMVKKYIEIKKCVHKRAKPSVVKDMINYLNGKKILNLWGMNKGKKGFLEKHIYLSLYKYMFDVGFSNLFEEVSKKSQNSGWVEESEKTLRLNIQKVRSALREWGSDKIYLRGKDQWKKSSKTASLGKTIKDSLLLIDSFDKKLYKPSDAPKPKDDEFYSGNEKSRAARYMGLCDFSGFINQLWGPYSPKVYDGSFLRIQQKWFSKELDDTVILADDHFRDGKKIFKNIKFHTKYRTPQKQRKGSKTIPSELSKDKKKYNDEISKARSRVEIPWGVMNKKFECLGTKFQEDIEAQGDLVYIASGIINMENIF